MKQYMGILCSIALTGCAASNSLRTKLSADSSETKDEKRVLITEMRNAYFGCDNGPSGVIEPARDEQAAGRGQRDYQVSSANCQNFALGLAEFKQVKVTDKKLNDNDPSQKPEKQLQARVIRFMDAGTTLSDVYCDEFFRSVNLSARKRQFSKGLTTDTSTLVAGVLNLVKAGSAALTASTVGFNAVNSSFRNYDESFMVDADLAKMRRLVLAAQDSMKLKFEDDPPRSIFSAESKVIRYAGLCSFLGMKDLLNDSIAAKTTAIENDRLSKSDQGKKQKTDESIKPDDRSKTAVRLKAPSVSEELVPASMLIAPVSQPAPPG